MPEIKLIAYERDFKFVGVCTCGKRWNLPEQRVRKATIDDVTNWLIGQGIAFNITTYNDDGSIEDNYVSTQALTARLCKESTLPDWQKSSLAT